MCEVHSFGGRIPYGVGHLVSSVQGGPWLGLYRLTQGDVPFLREGRCPWVLGRVEDRTLS